MDITDFYPNTTVPEGEGAMNRHLPPDIAAVCIKFSNLIHKTLYVQTPVGWYLLPERYGIGLVHSGEACDLVWSHTEQSTLLALEREENIVPVFYGRIKDDVVMFLDCTDNEMETVIERFGTADPNKPITVQVSSQTVDSLDVTLHKGSQFRLTGKLDTNCTPNHHPPHYTYQGVHTTQTLHSMLS